MGAGGGGLRVLIEAGGVVSMRRVDCLHDQLRRRFPARGGGERCASSKVCNRDHLLAPISISIWRSLALPRDHAVSRSNPFPVRGSGGRAMLSRYSWKLQDFRAALPVCSERVSGCRYAMATYISRMSLIFLTYFFRSREWLYTEVSIENTWRHSTLLDLMVWATHAQKSLVNPRVVETKQRIVHVLAVFFMARGVPLTLRNGKELLPNLPRFPDIFYFHARRDFHRIFSFLFLSVAGGNKWGRRRFASSVPPRLSCTTFRPRRKQLVLSTI